MPESFRTLLYSESGAVATIILNRPKAMNSFNDEMGDELERITDKIRYDQSIRAVLLKGNGGLFMAGGDIRFFYEQMDTMPANVRKIVRTLNATILNLMEMSKPVLASVHGSVAGVGMSLMLACDLVVAAADTRFTTAYSGIGISPDGGASWQLPRHVGPKKAMEWLLLSDIFDAEMAHAYGLVNRVVPPDTLASETDALLRRLAAGPAKAYANCKRLVNETWGMHPATQLEKEGQAFEACSASTDFKSGITGFLKKTTPVFGSAHE